MWTRPDGFIYLGAVAVGFLLFNGGRAIGQSRLGLLKTLLGAGALTTLLYLPWLLWAWHYYGSPIPHTILAKSLLRMGSPLKPGPLLVDLLNVPILGCSGELLRRRSTFLPAYALQSQGWHWTAVLYGKCLAYVCALYWCLPFGRPQGRAVSFAFMLGHFYLSAVAPAPYPWYVPPCGLLGVFAFAHVVQHGLSFALLPRDKNPWSSRLGLTGLRVLAAVVLSATLLLMLCSAYQLRIQHREIEEGTREANWPLAAATCRGSVDTVFLEPLGYIGFFRN